jgi:hypothetical protein
MLSNPVFRLVNNWLHDVGTGLWAACLLVIWVIDSRMGTIAAEEALSALRDVEWLIFWLLVGALVDIAVTGAIRLFYWRAETPASEMGSKRPALIGKHVAFLVIYGGGTFLAWSMIAA